MGLNLNTLRDEAAQTGADLTKPQAGGGGDFAPPAIGPTRLRFVSYVETGVHTRGVGTGRKTKPRVELGFELSGPKHEPKVLDDGRKIPFRIKIKEVLGRHEKNNYIKIFNLMNTDGAAKNFLDLLMDWKGRGMVSHYTFKGDNGQERTIAQLREKGPYQIFPVSFNDPESGDLRTVAVPPALSEPMVFLWDNPTIEQWDTLDRFTRVTIGKAENFEGSLAHQMLAEAGRLDEIKPQSEDDTEAEPEGASLTEEQAPAQSPAPAPKPATKAPAKAPASPAKAAKPTPKATPAATDGDPLQGL